MKPWREIAHPHPDVLEGTFQQSEFAADITAVRTGQATREYQDAAAFFERTFITEGMRLLLTSVAKRLNGQGGDPVARQGRGAVAQPEIGLLQRDGVGVERGDSCQHPFCIAAQVGAKSGPDIPGGKAQSRL